MYFTQGQQAALGGALNLCCYGRAHRPADPFQMRNFLLRTYPFAEVYMKNSAVIGLVSLCVAVIGWGSVQAEVESVNFCK